MLSRGVHLTPCTWLEVPFHLPWNPLQWVGALKAERRARNIVFVIVFTLPSNISSSQNIKHPHHHCHNFHHELCGKLSYKGTFIWMWGPYCEPLIWVRGSGMWDGKCRLNIHHGCVTTPLWIVSRVAKMSQSKHPHSSGPSPSTVHF